MACPVCLDGCLDLHTQPASIADDGERVQPPRIRCIVKPHNLVMPRCIQPPCMQHAQRCRPDVSSSRLDACMVANPLWDLPHHHRFVAPKQVSSFTESIHGPPRPLNMVLFCLRAVLHSPYISRWILIV